MGQYVQNSTLQPWLDFNISQPLGFSPSCASAQSQINGVQVTQSCVNVCNHTFAMLIPDKSQALLTCGLWAILAVGKYYPLSSVDDLSSNSAGDISLYNRQLDQNFRLFEGLGLNSSDFGYIMSVRSAIEDALNELVERTRTRDRLETSFGSKFCSSGSIFQLPPSDPSLVWGCLHSICAPNYTNQGIGVFASLLMQLGFSVSIMISLLCLAIYLPISRKRVAKHLLNLTTGLIEFHKAQCYFILVIQVAGVMSLYKPQIRQTLGDSESDDDTLLFVPIALNGLVSVAFTLQNILLFARMSWHILILSFLPFCRSTAILVPVSWSMRLLQPDFQTYIIGGDFNFTLEDMLNTAKGLCGSRSDGLRLGPSWTDYNLSLIWMIYAYCLTWAFFCLAKHILDTRKENCLRSRLRISLIAFSQRVLSGWLPVRVLAASILAFTQIMWLFCFAYAFYLYVLFIKASAISPTWYFGQIIATNAWTPFIVELVYLELKGIEDGSRYRYPPGVQAVVYGLLAHRTLKTQDPEGHPNDTFTHEQREETSEVSLPNYAEGEEVRKGGSRKLRA